MSRHPSPQFALAREHLSACSARLSYGSYRHLGQQLLAAFAVNAVCIAALFVLPDAEAIFAALAVCLGFLVSATMYPQAGPYLLSKGMTPPPIVSKPVFWAVSIVASCSATGLVAQAAFDADEPPALNPAATESVGRLVVLVWAGAFALLLLALHGRLALLNEMDSLHRESYGFDLSNGAAKGACARAATPGKLAAAIEAYYFSITRIVGRAALSQIVVLAALSAGLLCTRSAAGAAFYGCGILVLSVQGVVSLALSTRFYAAHEIRLPWTPTLLVDAPLLLTAIGCFVPLGVDVYEAAH